MVAQYFDWSCALTWLSIASLCSFDQRNTFVKHSSPVKDYKMLYFQTILWQLKERKYFEFESSIRELAKYYLKIRCKYISKLLNAIGETRAGNLFTITGRVNCALSLVGRKSNYFCPKILPLSNYEEE